MFLCRPNKNYPYLSPNTTSYLELCGKNDLAYGTCHLHCPLLLLHPLPFLLFLFVPPVMKIPETILSNNSVLQVRRGNTVNPLITIFVITAKFVIMSIWSAQKSAGCVFFHCYSHVILQENIRFVNLLESPCRGDSNKYTKRMSHKKLLFKSIRYSCLRAVHNKFLYNSKFDLTAISLVKKQCHYNESPL